MEDRNAAQETQARGDRRQAAPGGCLVSQGQSVADAVRSIGVTEVTYYRWRQEYGGLKTEQVKRLKELETENARLRRAVAELTLDKLILKEAASGNY
jgi:transposase-like protein